MGFFAFWGKPGDPYSLYADDIALFIENVSQLPAVIEHIHYVGCFTGLSLNLEKMIAFQSKQDKSTLVGGVSIRNKPVKYLGVYLGLGDLSNLNFEKPLRSAQEKIKGI